MKIKKLEWEQEQNPAYGSANFIASYFYIMESVIKGKWEWYWFSIDGKTCLRNGGLCNSVEECKQKCQELAELVIASYVVDF